MLSPLQNHGGGYEGTEKGLISRSYRGRTGSGDRSEEARILENDIVTIWGNNWSTISYTAVMGASMRIPAVVAEYIEVSG